MANKTQAKAAVDAVAVQIKNDIDTILPVGVDIREGDIHFGPGSTVKWFIRMNAVNLATADSWLATIQTNLTTALRTFSVTKLRRSIDGEPEKTYMVNTVLADYKIVNF